MLTNHESLFQLQRIDLWLHDSETIAKVFNIQPSAILSVSQILWAYISIKSLSRDKLIGVYCNLVA